VGGGADAVVAQYQVSRGFPPGIYAAKTATAPAEAHPCVQSRARCHGNAGMNGRPVIVEPVTYRIQRSRVSPNPALSARITP
jgi:hypothetical protein